MLILALENKYTLIQIVCIMFTGTLCESPNSSNYHVKSEAIGEEDSDEGYSNHNYYYSRIADRLSDEEKQEVLTLSSIRSDNPAFFTVLQMSHVRRRSNFLIFPRRFVADHLDNRLHEITLCRPNRKDKWCVKYKRGRDSQGIRNYNFFKFVRENKLREGDICAFELMKGARRTTMTVHAIRKVDEKFTLVGYALLCPGTKVKLLPTSSRRTLESGRRRGKLEVSFTTERRGSGLESAKEIVMMVEKGCENCREWQEHYYWEHMDLRKIRFFKLMTSDFAKGISIPEKFVKNFKKTKRVDLQAPSGDTWRIGVEKHDDELYLLSGWEDFVKAQEMKENDLLIFTCSGNSSFDVLIFEASGCVKVSSLFGPNMCKHFNNTAARQVEHHFLSDSDDTSMPSRLVRSANIASTSKKSRGTEPDSLNNSSYKANQGKHDENYSLSDSVDTTTQSQLVGSPQGATTSQNCSGKKSRMLPESPNSTNDQFKREEIDEEDSDEEYSNPNYYYTMIANVLLSA
ncbi:hypothetical protein EJB05_00670, partial [Eragrostis curvula]